MTMHPIDRMNDGSDAPPRLRHDINSGTLLGLPHGSAGWRATFVEQLAMVKAQGCTAVQSWNQSGEVRAAGLIATGAARIMQASEADALVRDHKQAGLEATTLHVGNSFETDAQIDTLVAAVLEASARHSYPLYIETHRGTITQDMRRTLDMVERFPEVRFNADLSHWYTGHELNYGGEFLSRIQHLQPVFERVRFMHARVGNAGSIQTALTDDGPYLDHFRLLWQRCFEGFLRGAQPGDFLSFNAELLPKKIGDGPQALWVHYAQPRADLADDPLAGEPSDRYLDAERLWEIASESFETARTSVAAQTGIGNKP